MDNNNRNYYQPEAWKVTHHYDVKATSKQIRKISFEFGYGLTQGIFAATFVTHMTFGIIKAIKKRAEKKVGIEVKVEPDESSAEENTET